MASSLEPKPHPLENPAIMKHLFQLMGPTSYVWEMKQWRLVSKTWHKESLDIFRKTARISILEKHCCNPGFIGISLENYLSEWQNPESPYQFKEKPFHNYNLPCILIHLGLRECDAQNRAFWDVVGPHMRVLSTYIVNLKRGSSSGHLQANERIVMDSLQMKIMIKWLHTKVPNLEALYLYGASIYGPTDLSDESALSAKEKKGAVLLQHPKLKELTINSGFPCQLNHFPNLESLTIYDAEVPLDRRLASNAGSLRATRATRFEHLTLKYLQILTCDVVTCEHPIRLPALEHLSISLDSFCADATFPIDLIQTSAEKLRTLIVWDTETKVHDAGLFRVAFPFLTILRVCGPLVSDLGFLRLMPNLKVLQLDPDCSYYKSLQDVLERRIKKKNAPILPKSNDLVAQSEKAGVMAGVVLDKMETVSFNFPLELASFRLLGKWMPNLKILEGTFDREGAEVAFQVWSDLKLLWLIWVPRKELKLLRFPKVIPPGREKVSVREHMFGPSLQLKSGRNTTADIINLVRFLNASLPLKNV